LALGTKIIVKGGGGALKGKKRFPKKGYARQRSRSKFCTKGTGNTKGGRTSTAEKACSDFTKTKNEQMSKTQWGKV